MNHSRREGESRVDFIDRMTLFDINSPHYTWEFTRRIEDKHGGGLIWKKGGAPDLQTAKSVVEECFIEFGSRGTTSKIQGPRGGYWSYEPKENRSGYTWRRY